LKAAGEGDKAVNEGDEAAADALKSEAETDVIVEGEDTDSGE